MKANRGRAADEKLCEEKNVPFLMLWSVSRLYCKVNKLVYELVDRMVNKITCFTGQGESWRTLRSWERFDPD